ncbi:MAG TPA: AAA family ATPase, partial [Kofleriaceae bacterium]|nr:AAA family ATPase [Kofleriaceae bacterium]
CVLFECLTGRPAFSAGEMLAIFCKILLEETPRLGAAAGSPEVDDLVARMMAKDRDDRPDDCAALAAELARVRAGQTPATEAPARRSGITSGERQLLSVVLAGSADDHADAGMATTVRVVDGSDTARLTSIAARFGGQLESLANGAVVITLPSRGPATDLAERAARCALALQAAGRHNRLALATGRADVGGRRPTGEVLERVAQLLQAAEPDRGPRVDDVTVGLLGTSFEIDGDDRGLLLAGEREPARPVRKLLGKPTACVGRAREQLTVDAVFAECAAELVPRAVLITGPPGIGKSRLRYELVRKLEDGGAAEILLARGHPMHLGSSLSMVGSAIRRAAGVRDGEPPAAQQQRLRARIARHLDPGHAERVVAFVGELAGVEFPVDHSPLLRAAREAPLQMAEQMRLAFDDWLAAECAVRPVVLVLEDLHWGDTQTVHLVDRALAAQGDRPLLVVAMARPEVDQAFPDLWAGRAVTQIRLAELSRRAAETLVREVLGTDVDAAVVDRVVAHAAGNAFYLEELIRAVADGRGQALPPTVLAMVQARIEALPAEARRALRAAGVFGARFWHGGVVDILGGDSQRGMVDEWLAFLERAEVVTRSVERKFPAESEYVFRHALVADAAYAMLTDADRQVGHRLAALWLERTGESDPRVLAGHFELGGEGARAAEWYLRAGERLLADGTPEPAAATLRRVDALPLPEAALPRQARAVQQVNRLLGDHQATLTWVRGRLERRPGAEALAALLEAELSALRQIDVRGVLERCDAALAAADAAGDEEIRASVLAIAAFAAYRMADLAGTERHAAAAAAMTPASGRARFHLLRARLFAAAMRHDVEEMVAISGQVRDQAAALGDLAGAANECNNLAEAQFDLGRPAQARADADRAVELATACGHRALLASARFMLARADAESGDLDGGVDAMVAALHALRSMISYVDLCTITAFFLLERGRDGDHAMAAELASAGLVLAAEVSARHCSSDLHAALARARWRSGDPAAADRELAAMRAAYAPIEDAGQYHGALAVHEIAGADDAAGTIAAARARLLAAAARRRDPRAYLTGTRLHRRLLEISGGVPDVA